MPGSPGAPGGPGPLASPGRRGAQVWGDLSFSAGPVLLGRGRRGYDRATGVITARLSTDAGNTTAFGTDRGLFTLAGCGGEPTALGVTGSPTLDLTASGTGTAADPYELTGAVILDQVNVAPARCSGAGQPLRLPLARHREPRGERTGGCAVAGACDAALRCTRGGAFSGSETGIVEERFAGRSGRGPDTC